MLLRLRGRGRQVEDRGGRPGGQPVGRGLMLAQVLLRQELLLEQQELMLLLQHL